MHNFVSSKCKLHTHLMPLCNQGVQYKQFLWLIFFFRFLKLASFFFLGGGGVGWGGGLSLLYNVTLTLASVIYFRKDC